MGFIHTNPRYSIKQTEKLTDRAHSTIYRDIGLGRLKTYKVGKRTFVSPEALDEYIALDEQEGIDKVVEFEKSEAMEV